MSQTRQMIESMVQEQIRAARAEEAEEARREDDRALWDRETTAALRGLRRARAQGQRRSW